MKRVINIPGAPQPVGPYSQALQVDDTLYISGQIPIDPVTGVFVQGDITEQTRQVMMNISNLLDAAGMAFADVVKASIFLNDINDFAMVNEIYASYFTSAFPARETVQVARLPKDARLEISVIAIKKAR